MFRSILDNLFQNVIQHDGSGKKYVCIESSRRNGVSYLIVKDKGPDMEHDSQAKGAGIGLLLSLWCHDDLGTIEKT
ncbi:hypothetical protein PAAL109150_18410 [Paenibacillus alkaliterrae]